MEYSFLEQRAVLRLSGEECESFLQGLISNDVRKLASGAAVYATLLSPQGKFLHDFFLLAHEGEVLLDVDASRAHDLIARLSMYKLRTKVTIERTELAVAAVWGEAAPTLQAAPFAHAVDPRLSALGVRIIGEKNALSAWLSSTMTQQRTVENYEQLRLEHSVPDGARDFIIERTLLLEAGVDALHGVDFNKGCYVGQEVTARSKFRAQLRKSLAQVRASAALPEIGTTIIAHFSGEDIALGELRSSHGAVGLAFVQLDVWERARTENAPISAGGITLTLASPAWLPPATAA
jgi:tRNA-modifying protein YgfZ